MYTQVWDYEKNQVSNSLVIRDSDQAWIPFDERNRDYLDYLEWVSAGNRPTPVAVPETQPVLPITESLLEELQALKDKVAELEAK